MQFKKTQIFKIIKKKLNHFRITLEISKFKRKKEVVALKKTKKSELPIYFINLDESINRKIKLEQQLKHYFINVQRVRAISGKNLKNNIYANKAETFTYDFTQFRNCNLKANEVGCTLSHFKAVNIIYENKHPYAIVFEDDVDLKYMRYWGITLEEIINNAPEDFDIIKLHSFSKILTNLKFLNSEIRYREISSYPKQELSTAGLIWSDKGINKMRRFFDKNHLMVSSKDTESIVADYVLFKLNKTYQYTMPLIFTPNADSSTVGNDISYQDRFNKYVDLFYK